MTEDYDFDRLHHRAVTIVERVQTLGHDDAVVIVLDSLLDVRRRAHDETTERLRPIMERIELIIDRVEHALEQVEIVESGG